MDWLTIGLQLLGGGGGGGGGSPLMGLFGSGPKVTQGGPALSGAPIEDIYFEGFNPPAYSRDRGDLFSDAIIGQIVTGVIIAVSVSLITAYLLRRGKK